MADTLDFFGNLLSGGSGGSSTTTAAAGSNNTISQLIAGANAFSNLSNSLKTDNKTPITAPVTPISSTYNIVLPTQPESADEPKTIVTGQFGVDTQQPTTTKKDNTLLYVGIGTGVIVVVLLIYFTLKKK